MKNKLFRSDIEASCEYCAHGSEIGGGSVVCVKRGVLPMTDGCPKFSYDPLKRRPAAPKKLNTGSLKDEDFEF